MKRTLLLLFLVFAARAQQQTINNEAMPAARVKINANFTDLYTNKAKIGSCALGTFAIQTTTSGVVCVAVDWSMVTGIPSTFAPASHASSHAAAGSDPVTPAAIGAQAAIGFTPENAANKGANGGYLGIGSDGSVAITGTVLRGGGTSLPGTCAIGDQYFLTTGTTGNYQCTATNRWSLPGSGGAGSPPYSCTVSGVASIPCTHNLGTITPWVGCWDASGNMLGSTGATTSITSVVATSASVATLTFSGSTTGTCVISTGGMGQQGEGPTVTVEPVGANCSYGGSKFVSNGVTTYACNGTPGAGGGLTSGVSLPASCSVGDAFNLTVKTTTANSGAWYPGLYYCAATNTWAKGTYVSDVWSAVPFGNTGASGSATETCSAGACFVLVQPMTIAVTVKVKYLSIYAYAGTSSPTVGTVAGVYDSAGALVGQGTLTSVPGTAAATFTLNGGTGIWLTPGQYSIAIASEDTTLTPTTVISSASQIGAIYNRGNASPTVGRCANKTSGTGATLALPATCGTVTVNLWRIYQWGLQN